MSADYKIISQASECTLRLFMACLFDSEYKSLILEGEPPAEAVMSAWRGIYMEYVDMSGTGRSDEIDLVKTIQLLDNRLKCVKMYVAINRQSLAELGVPFFPTFNDLRRYGHKIMWDANNPDPEAFLRMLKVIETKDTRYQAELDSKNKDLSELQKKREEAAAGKPVQTNRDRKEFIRLINSLGKFGFEIQKNATTVEEFAVMVADYSEYCETERARKNSKSKQ